MKKTAKFTALFLITLITGFALGLQQDRIEAGDVRSAGKLIGISFTETQIDTLLTYIERNRKGYDSLRAYQSNLNNDLVPPLYFDPFPAGFSLNTDQKPVNWSIPEDVNLPAERHELAFMTLPQLASLIRSRKISSKELTTLYLERIKEYDGQLMSVISLTEKLALEQANRADEEIAAGNYRGPLHGIPYGIKDLFAVDGYKTTWGAAPYQDQKLNYNATVVKKLEEAGAVLIAKLTSGALARGDVWFGGKTRNPWDLDQGASGSSAGSGAATSAGLVGFSIGTETLGSIVSPATRSGITGLRPTYGAVSRYGCMALSWSMDKPGPICRSATGCAMVFDAIRGRDELDRTTIDAAFNYISDPDLTTLKIGYLEDQFEADTSDNSVNNAKSLKIFKSMGINPVPVRLPTEIPYSAFDIILRAESGAFFDELVLNGGDSLMVQQHKGSRANSLRQSRFIPAVEYLQANRHRSVLIERFHETIKEFDVLISPTFGRQLLVTNLTGHPVISVPNGFDAEGHPTSITLVGNLFDEATIVSVAEVFQNATDFDNQYPPLFNE